MSAPPVQYVTTCDGYSIAYTVTGNGEPFVLLPSWINHVQDVWTDGMSVANLLRDASERYRVINYDSRGMGMSTRGVANLSFDSYLTDLETVLEHLKLTRFVLVGFATFTFLAARFALRYPERVSALILIGPPYRAPPALWDDLAQQDYESYLSANVSRFYSPEMQRKVLEIFRRWATQEDYLASAHVWDTVRIESPLDELKTPTLVLWSRGLTSGHQKASEFGRLLPGARLVTLDSGLPYGAPGEAIGAIEPFLRDVGIAPQSEMEHPSSPNGLSEREIEVLRLVATGRSNAQIADELTISQHTVIRHVSRILDKTGTINRTEAASYAHRHGLVN